jgi:Stigma-specific protein, Stig1/zinc-ribbon domain
MTRICPRCGNVNDEAVKFCISCGNPLVPLVPQAGQPVTATTPPPGQVSQAEPSGKNSTLRIISIAAVAVIVILAALYFMQASGTLRIYPFSAPAVTPRVTPTSTSYITTETLPTETTTPILEITMDSTNTTESPSISPTAKKALVCPSDRHACGADCTDIMTDQNNCGGCNITCAVSQDCIQGQCREGCPTGETSCFDGCHDLLYDAQNCGICGNSCPVGLACNKSICTPPPKTTVPIYTG